MDGLQPGPRRRVTSASSRLKTLPLLATNLPESDPIRVMVTTGGGGGLTFGVGVDGWES